MQRCVRLSVACAEQQRSKPPQQTKTGFVGDPGDPSTRANPFGRLADHEAGAKAKEHGRDQQGEDGEARRGIIQGVGDETPGGVAEQEQKKDDQDEADKRAKHASAQGEEHGVFIGVAGRDHRAQGQKDKTNRYESDNDGERVKAARGKERGPDAQRSERGKAHQGRRTDDGDHGSRSVHENLPERSGGIRQRYYALSTAERQSGEATGLRQQREI